MTRTNERNAKAEPLNFPNPSRRYDETRHGVLFWGYDQALEVAFVVEDSALSKVDLETKTDAAGFLETFDANREQICAIAGNIYSRRRKASHIFSFTLTDADF